MTFEDSPVIGWRVKATEDEIHLMKWGEPDRLWVLPLRNVAEVSALPQTLVFEERKK